MALESLTGSAVYIDSLVATNPVGATDPKSQGDDHIRGIKNTLLNTFPNIDGPVTADQDELNLLDGCTVSFNGISAILGGSAQLDALTDGTVIPFFQASAPVGWTQSTAHTDKALRVVSGSGGGSGGTTALSTLAHTHTGPSHTHTGPSHQHIVPIGGSSGSLYHGNPYGDAGDITMTGLCSGSTVSTLVAPRYSSSAGTGATGASGTDSTGSTSISPKYVDVILCAKDAA